jgi:hypothetical protein
VDQREMIRRWVANWQTAAPELEALRRQEVREADILRILAFLEPGS